MTGRHEEMIWNALEALRLSEAGRHAEALEQPGVPSAVSAIVRFWARRPADIAADTATQHCLEGWTSYYRAQYCAALARFDAALASDPPRWIAAWAALGMSKVACDAGAAREGLGWCGIAHALARQGEHLEHLAAVAGSRGEILLRSGFALEAAHAFSEDVALLPPGNRYRGRVRCYLAHAWARLGENGRKAAGMAYRLAGHVPGDPTTRSYAAAGLALLGVRSKEYGLVEEALHWQPQEMSLAWCLVAKALVQPQNASKALAGAYEAMPAIYLHERRWLARLAREHAPGLIESPPCGSDHRPPVPDPCKNKNWRHVCRIDLPVDPDSCTDVPCLADAMAIEEKSDVLTLRDRFMP